MSVVTSPALASGAAGAQPFRGELALEYNTANHHHVRFDGQARSIRDGRRGEPDAPFDIETRGHVAFKVYRGDRPDAPRDDPSRAVARETRAKKIFHLSGRIAAIVKSSPRGALVQLRPVT